MIKHELLVEQFLHEWLTWAMEGASDSRFSRGMGLCNNLCLWLVDNHGIEQPGYSKAYAHLKQMFDHDGLHMEYPFGEESFNLASRSETMHLDPRRLAWVRSKVNG